MTDVLTTANDRPLPRGALIGFFLLALILLASGMGLRDPWPSDEPRFNLVAKTMVETGDYWFPRRGVDLYSDKPPMFMWMQVAAYKLVGEWRIAFLLPSLLACLITLGLTYDLGKRLWNPRVGLYAALLTLFASDFLFQGKRAQIDPVLVMWVTLANWGLLMHCLRGPNWPAFWLGCFAAGLGVITKGVGVIALLMLLPYAFARWRGFDHVAYTEKSAVRWLLGIPVFLGAIAIWLVPMLFEANARGAPEYQAYVDDILLRQTAKRYADSWSHIQPFYYYAVILIVNWFPLSLTYIGAVPRWIDAFRAGDARIALPLMWTTLIVLFFSIPAGKRDVYIMPAIPMVALAVAPYLDDMLSKRWLRYLAFGCVVTFALLLAAAGLWAILKSPEVAQRYAAQRGLADGGFAAWSMLIGMGAWMGICALWAGPARGFKALLVGLFGVWMFWSWLAYPLLNESSSGSRVMRIAGETIGKDAELALVGWKEQNMLFADRPVVDFGFKRPRAQQFADAVAWLAKAPEQRWVFSLGKAMGECVVRERAKRVGHSNRREWWVFQLSAVVPDCVPQEAGAEEADDDEPGA
jgi:4-amino-4-deoxy-L-arabinose transferase-like glycosyltransferase